MATNWNEYFKKMETEEGREAVIGAAKIVGDAGEAIGGAMESNNIRKVESQYESLRDEKARDYKEERLGKYEMDKREELDLANSRFSFAKRMDDFTDSIRKSTRATNKLDKIINKRAEADKDAQLNEHLLGLRK